MAPRPHFPLLRAVLLRSPLASTRPHHTPPQPPLRHRRGFHAWGTSGNPPRGLSAPQHALHSLHVLRVPAAPAAVDFAPIPPLPSGRFTATSPDDGAAHSQPLPQPTPTPSPARETRAYRRLLLHALPKGGLSPWRHVSGGLPHGMPLCDRQVDLKSLSAVVARLRNVRQERSSI